MSVFGIPVAHEDEEEHQAGIIRRAELPVDGQAEQVAVEAAAAVLVAGAQQDPAARYVHATIPASRWVTRKGWRERAQSRYACRSGRP